MVVAKLLAAGDQAPVNPLIEDVGNVIVSPKQIGAIVLNVGATGGPTFTVKVAVVAH